MKTVIKQIKCGAVVLIPDAIMTASGLRIGDRVGIRAMNGTITLTPSSSTQKLDDLVARIKPDNQHELIDLG